MSAGLAVGVVAAVIVPVMAVLWYRQLRTREADVVDLAWTVGLGGAAVFYAAAVPVGVGWWRVWRGCGRRVWPGTWWGG